MTGLEPAASWSQTIIKIFFRLFSPFLALFAPKKILFDTLVSTVSTCSEVVYGQRCGQKRFPGEIKMIAEW
jgi:hypothetical protein